MHRIDELTERWDRIKEIETSSILEGKVVPKFMWMSDGGVELALYPDMDPTIPRRVMATALRMLSAGAYHADELWQVMDSYSATSLVKKNGQEWERGDMQYAVQHQTEDAELVSDCLMTNVANREGRTFGVTQKYRVVDGEVDWFEDPKVLTSEGGDGEDAPLKVVGIMAEMMQDAMTSDTAPTLVQAMTGKSMSDLTGMSGREIRLHAMLGAVRAVMAEIGWPCGIGSYGEEEAAIIERSMSRAGLRAEVMRVDADEE